MSHYAIQVRIISCCNKYPSDAPLYGNFYILLVVCGIRFWVGFFFKIQAMTHFENEEFSMHIV